VSARQADQKKTHRQARIDVTTGNTPWIWCRIDPAAMATMV
jgi:hypothetical protein